MPFRVINELGQGMVVLDGSPCASRGRGSFLGFLPNSILFTEMYLTRV